MSTASLAHEQQEPTPIHAVTEPTALPLTATERSAFLGLQAQAREYERAVNEQERAIVAEIETRLGLDVGAIGTSHTVNPQTWQVVAMPQLDAQIAAIEQQHAEAVVSVTMQETQGAPDG